MYNYCNPNEIRPSGWLKKQLEIQAKGLAGNLDKIWPDVRDSSWIGGNRNDWERAPYWLDGFIPLAYLLEDEDMIQRAGRYVTAILGHQQPDGWICPCTEEEREYYDIWSWFLIGKILAMYCEFTESKEAEDALYRTMKCMHKQLMEGKVKVGGWASFRWYECFIPLQFLYDKYPEEWILELGKELKKQGVNFDDLLELWKRPVNAWRLDTHIVNIMLMLKEEAVSKQLFGEDNAGRAEHFWKHLEKYNGTAVGVFTGDECLAGVDNNHGTELCSVVDLMYSCEILYAVTGDPIWMERLEKMTFNALPATISDDMWTHQYDQQVNQIACVKFPGKSFFRTNSEEAHLFGLEPHFGCCTANHGQGWPKLVMSIFHKSDAGIHATMMLPGELHTTIQDAKVDICIDTEYPFRHTGKYVITTDKPVNFEFKIRIPRWATAVRINGVETVTKDYYTINKVWEGTETIEIALDAQPHYVNRPYDLRTVEYGPLVFALPLNVKYTKIEYEKDGVERKYPYCDYELSTDSEWRYGFADEKLTVCEKEGNEIPFSSECPRVVIQTKLSRVQWDYADGYTTVAEKCPDSNIPLSEPQEMTLIPYGCAKLRMTEMPFVNDVKLHPLRPCWE